MQPLVDTITASKPEEVDNVIVRIYAGAVRAYLAQDNLEKAVEIGMALADWGPDVQGVNAALVEVVKALNAKRKQAEEAVAAEGGQCEFAEPPRKPGQN